MLLQIDIIELYSNTKTPLSTIFTLKKEATRKECGSLLRPLGNTLYWLPPLNAAFSVWEQLQTISLKALEEMTKQR